MKGKITLILAFSMLCLTSCFDIIEEVTLNKDGSGKFSYTIDMSATALLIKDDTAQQSIMSDYTQAMIEDYKKKVASLKLIPGISNPKADINEKVGTYKFSYDFSSIDALNTAIKQTADSKDGKASNWVYKFDGENFERDWQMLTNLNDEEDEFMNEMAGEILGGHYYTSIVNFSTKVKEVGREFSVISDDRRTVTNKFNLIDIYLHWVSVNYTVKVKK